MLNNSSIQIIDDNFYVQMGSTWILDSIYLIVIIPLGVIGLISNIFNFYVIFRINVNISTYKYLKVYCLNSSLIGFISIFTLYGNFTIRFTGIKTDLFARIYRCFIVNYVATSLYFYGNMLDIVIVIDRLSIFVNFFKKLSKINPLNISIFLAIICFTINLPTFFRFRLKSDEEILYDFTESSINSSYLAFGICGSWYLHDNIIIVGLNIIGRDLLTLCLEIIFSILSVIYFIRFKESRKSIKIQSVKDKKMTDKADDNRLSAMTRFLLIISLITHIAACIAFFFFFTLERLTLHYFIMIANLSIVIKHSINFFIFYHFNKNFKSIFSKLFKNE